MAEKVLVIGSGGREQALAWKLAQSTKVEKVFVAPGNGGSDGSIENVAIGFTDVPALLAFAQDNKISLTVIGQEAASDAGAVDAFKAAGFTIFGPTKAATRLESSKAFSKDLMAEEGIPTAEFQTFHDAHEAVMYACSRPFPVVIKADGLATGKGVFIAYSSEDVEDAIDAIMLKRIFGESGDKVVVEDFLKGQEVSVHALCDGKEAVIFPASQDHKQVFDGDKGPNTGGMGVIAPVPWVTEEHLALVSRDIVQPALRGLAKKQTPFTGCLYPGLMIDGEVIKLLEFNARFGDPEAEVYMRLLDADLYDVLTACANGQLNPSTIQWKSGFAVTVVLCAPGYPGDYPKGLPISGIAAAEELDDIVVFHSATTRNGDDILTAGGRVINVTAIEKAYGAAKLIHFEGMHYRTDIGRRQQG
jgi:phosphoribosylamine--glycine ligase